MNDETRFAAAIEELVTLARSQGNVLSKAQVEDGLSELGIQDDKIEPVYEYLKSKNIGIDEQPNLEEYLTKDEADYLAMYTESLKELKEYSEGEKQAACISALAGEPWAKKQVIEMMLPDIVDLAKLYSGQGVMLEDLIGEGNIALTMGVEMLGALESSDEVMGSLATMAMNAMEELIATEEGERKADEKLAAKVNRVTDAARVLAEELNRKITVDELVNEGRISRKAIEEAIRLSGNKITYFEGSKE